MCGIVGMVGRGPVAGRLLEGLRRLEYRGYDSAGIATLEDGRTTRRRVQGKLVNLEALLQAEPLGGSIGIGHTRWATHGRATRANAHPHSTRRVSVVHNGIIENFRDLRGHLEARGHVFSTDTDTEVAAHLVTDAMDGGLGPEEAVASSLPRLHGAFALGFLFEGRDDMLIGARRGAPLAIGYGEAGTCLGSDALALAPFSDSLSYLEEGDWVVLTREGASVFDAGGRPASRYRIAMAPSAFVVDKDGHRHFMAKEIHEQPEVVGRTLSHYLDMAAGRVALPFELPVDVKGVDKLTVAACGTAYMAGLTSKYWFERYARLPVTVEAASEFRHGDVPMSSGGLTLVVSQSGETADTLASLRHAKASGQAVLSVVNVATSSIARESDAVAATLAGPEIGVASTKAFTCQLAVLACLALAFGRARGVLSSTEERRLVGELVALPGLMAEALTRAPVVEALARELAKAHDVLYLGRGTSFPLAAEGALKLKELSYIHAEGYAAGELKHGPIALVDDAMPVIILMPDDAVYEKTASNVHEVAARGGRLILLGGSRMERDFPAEVARHVVMPDMAPDFTAIPYAVLLQMIAYSTALLMGKDVDQPRNLAKCVTVE